MWWGKRWAEVWSTSKGTKIYRPTGTHQGQVPVHVPQAETEMITMVEEGPIECILHVQMQKGATGL